MTRVITSSDFEQPSIPANLPLLCTEQALRTAGRIAALLLEADRIVSVPLNLAVALLLTGPGSVAAV